MTEPERIRVSVQAINDDGEWTELNRPILKEVVPGTVARIVNQCQEKILTTYDSNIPGAFKLGERIYNIQAFKGMSVLIVGPLVE